ncbi:cytochrome bd oxidase small subunit CydS [Oceanobacillus salinisoli]
MFDDFLIFVAPIIITIAAIVISFWAALKDSPAIEEDE